jgi:hypothetical protein
MFRQRKRAIRRRWAKLENRQPPTSPEQAVAEIIELDNLSREARALIIDMLESRPNITPAESRLLDHYRKVEL